MLSELSHDKVFEKLLKKHIVSIIDHLLSNNYHFGVLCRIDNVTFSPLLDDNIQAEFRPLTLFFLAGYTFETAHMTQEHLIFEAGFGSDNTGSEVSVPLLDVIQIIVEETPIFVNSTSKVSQKAANVESPDSEKARDTSFEALMSNPENQKLLRKKK
ncbi:MAG: hypothetical protein OEW60_03390 [Thiovulaceae bacterium]|nr:hypothetical protein [Sulfurimonadaceae bacterium]